MAKKGQKGPTRPCVKCGKPVHPRAQTCKDCGAEQPQKSAKSKIQGGKKAAVKKTAAAQSDLGTSLDYVEKMGSLEAAEQSLAELRKIKEKLG